MADRLHRFHLPITTEDALREFVRVAWGVSIPDVQVCKNHSTPWRAFCDAYFARHRTSVWKASRGLGGKSYLLAVLGLTEAVTLKAGVTLLGGSGEQSQFVHEYMQAFWDYEGAPRHLLASDPSKQETRLSWGNRIKAIAASQRSVRGPHRPRVRIDEVDEVTLPILDAALGEAMSTETVPAQTVLSSTHQYPDGTMTEVLKRAKDNGWNYHEWCYRESVAGGIGWLSAQEVEEKRNDVTSIMWDVEYELQDPSPEDRAIDTEKVKAMFQEELGRGVGRNGEYLEFEAPILVCERCHAEYELGTMEPGAQCPKCNAAVWSDHYATGADWARKRDWTVIITLRTDVLPLRVVAFERCGRMPWPVMTDKFNQRINRYPGTAAHDGTGIGDVVDSQLDAGANPVIMVGRARSSLLTEYVNAIERGDIVSPFVEFMETEHRLASVDHLYGSRHLPDTIAGGALAYYAADLGHIFS